MSVQMLQRRRCGCRRMAHAAAVAALTAAACLAWPAAGTRPPQLRLPPFKFRGIVMTSELLEDQRWESMGSSKDARLVLTYPKEEEWLIDGWGSGWAYVYREDDYAQRKRTKAAKYVTSDFASDRLGLGESLARHMMGQIDYKIDKLKKRMLDPTVYKSEKLFSRKTWQALLKSDPSGRLQAGDKEVSTQIRPFKDAKRALQTTLDHWLNDEIDRLMALAKLKQLLQGEDFQYASSEDFSGTQSQGEFESFIRPPKGPKPKGSDDDKYSVFTVDSVHS